MKKTFLLLSLLFSTGLANAQSSITVLLVNGTGSTPADAIVKLVEIQQLMAISGLSNYEFENTGDHLGAPGLVIPSTCSGSNSQVLLDCVVDNHTVHRDMWDADIVILVVPTVNFASCGRVDDDRINGAIASSNDHLAFAVVAINCEDQGFIASHEVLHLLSIEHKNGDPQLSTPERDNHAWSSGSNVTAGGVQTDCSGQCTTIFNRMSDPNSTFPGGAAAGDNTHANAKRVVTEESWAVVAAYRPLFAGPPSPAVCNIPLFLGCHQPGCAAWIFSFSANNATQYRLESRLAGGSWQLETITTNLNHVPHLAGVPVEWRIKGENSWGSGDWCFFWTTGQCEGGDPPDPF